MQTSVPGICTASLGSHGSGLVPLSKSGSPNGTSVQLCVSVSVVRPYSSAVTAIRAASAVVFSQSNSGGTGCSSGHCSRTISAAALTACSRSSGFASARPLTTAHPPLAATLHEQALPNRSGLIGKGPILLNQRASPPQRIFPDEPERAAQQDLERGRRLRAALMHGG